MFCCLAEAHTPRYFATLSVGRADTASRGNRAVPNPRRSLEEMMNEELEAIARVGDGAAEPGKARESYPALLAASGSHKLAIIRC